MTISSPVRDLLQLALGSFPRSQAEKDRSRALLRCAYRGRTRKVRLSIVENCGGPGSGKPGPCPDPTSDAKKSAERTAKLFGLDIPNVQIHDLPGERTYGESSGKTIHLVNIQRGLPINKQINFPLARPVSEGEHLAAHEIGHWAYTEAPDIGKEAAERLSKVESKYGSAVSMYGSFGGKFENLMELGAVYSHSPESLKSYSPEMYLIAEDWVKSVRSQKKGQVRNDSSSQSGNRTSADILMRSGPSGDRSLRSIKRGLQHFQLREISESSTTGKSRCNLWRFDGDHVTNSQKIRIKDLAPYLHDLLGDVTKRDARAIARIVKRGVERRWKDSSVARAIVKSTKIDPDRAKVIARTEMSRARTDVGLGKKRDSDKVVFTLGAVDRTCPKCRALEGKVYTVRKAAGVIPVHPSCRCVWTDAPKGARVSNVFCATGKGGGVDPSCSYYHGTRRNFPKFKDGWNFFSKSKRYAENFGDKVLEVEFTLKNPIDLTEFSGIGDVNRSEVFLKLRELGFSLDEADLGYGEIHQVLDPVKDLILEESKELGFDGVIQKENYNGALTTSYVVFDGGSIVIKSK